MNKHVLFFFAISVVCMLLMGLLLAPASAEYLNDSWLRDRSEKYLEGEDQTIPAGDDLRFTAKRLFPDSIAIDTDHLTIGLRPPSLIPKSSFTVIDSVDSGRFRIVRRKEIPGLLVEKYYFIPFEEYSRENLEKSLVSNWRDNKSRVNKWVAGEKDGGITDLDFALPVGKRFEKFMGGKTRLDINGSQTITFSGKSEYDEGQIETSLSKNTSFPSLSMKQEPQFSIRGSVGDRITVDIKQEPSEGGFSLGNNLEDNISIKYKGEDNDIVQSIEAGNTSLSLQGATFAGYSGTHKGLFGIRSEGRLGPLKFTAIASQEKSESNVKTLRGSAEETANEIPDYNYKANTYFFLDFKYRNQFAENRTSLDQIIVDPLDSLVAIEVYEDDGNTTNDSQAGQLTLPGTVVPMNMEGTPEVKASAINGFFTRLEAGKDYYVDRSLGYIVFKQRVSDSSTIGVYMKTKSGQEFGSLVYDPDDTNSKISLKLIKITSQRPTDTDTWDLEWKNVYDLGQTNIDLDGLEIKIYLASSEGADRDTQDGTPIIQILGLDKFDELGNSTPDNKVDLNGTYVDQYRGELIFPLLHPFDSEPPNGVSIELNPKVPKIYETQNAEEREEASKYFIKVKTASRQKTIRIDSISGIMEGTEKVTLNGKTLSRGTDYTIVYQTGEITLLNADALSSTANIEVSYEEQNALSAMQKTLFGVRTEYGFWGDSRIGGVFLFNNESTTDKRVKLGQEPSRNMLLDTNADIKFESQRLTRLVDELPLVVADQKSTIRFEGEVAKSMPNMNTKGMVYIDDFEGSQNTTIGIGRTNWTTASAPDPNTTFGALTRGRIQWYNPWDRISAKDIWPNKETSSTDNTVHILNLAYGQAAGVSANQSWAGIMSPFYGSGIDMSRSRFIEVWARGNKGKLKIDIGSISEDFFPIDAPNDQLDTEDRDISGQGHGDGILTVEEDTGLDGVSDSQEPGYGSSNSDPNHDNWSYKDKNDYSHINGTEGNRYDSDRAGLPDTEDINGNGVLDTKESYYEYTIGLDDQFDPYLVADSVPPGNPGGWRLFRIPLWNNSKVVVGGSGAPDSTLIETARLWVTGTDSTIIQIASMEILENDWLEEGIFDESDEDVTETATGQVRITRVNTDENLDYDPPPGVAGEIDRDTNVRKMEQSLVIEMENISPGNAAFIYRSFSTKMDFTDYTSIKMFVHGSDEFPDDSTATSDKELVMRFGMDRDNYYEYRLPVYRGWADKNFVEAKFATCTALKLKEISDSLAVPADTLESAIYTLKGSPNLQNIKIFTIGIRNRNSASAFTGQVWLDELRMDNLREMGGTAIRANITTDLAGFINLTGKIEKRSADFHDMNSKKGSGEDETKWGTNVSMNADRFTPKRWNLSLPMRVDYNKDTSLPRLKSGSDIILNDDQKKEYSSGGSDKSFSMSYRKNSDPSQKGFKKHLLSWGLEKWNASYTRGTSESHTPTSGSVSTNNTEAKLTYNVNPTAKSVKPFSFAGELGVPFGNKMSNMIFNYTPNQLSYDIQYHDKNRINTNYEGVADTTKTRGITENINFGYDPLGNTLRYRYTQTKQRDLFLKVETDYKEVQSISLVGPKFGYFANSYEYTSSYTESNNPKYNLTLGGRKIGLDKKFSVTANVEWQRIIEDISGKPKLANSSSGEETERKKRKVKDRKPSKKKKDSSSGKDDQPETPVHGNDSLDGEPGEPGGKDSEDSGKNESDKKPEKPSEPQKPKKPGSRTKLFLAISNSLSPISMRLEKKDQAAYAGIAERPDFMTRSGQGEVQQSETTSVDARQYNSTSGSKTFTIDTSIRLPLDMGLKAAVKMSDNNRATLSSSSRSEQSTLPDLNLRWDNLDRRIPSLKKYEWVAKNISLSSQYAINNTKEWANDNPLPTTDRIKKSFSPLVSLNGMVMGGVQTTISYSRSTDTNQTLSGETSSVTITSQNSTDASFRYSVSPSSGLLRKFKLQSKIDLDMRISASNQIQQRSIENKEMAVIGKTSKWMVSPQATYQFSQKFTGSAMLRFENSKDLTNTVHKVREVSISGKMIF